MMAAFTGPERRDSGEVSDVACRHDSLLANGHLEQELICQAAEVSVLTYRKHVMAVLTERIDDRLRRQMLIEEQTHLILDDHRLDERILGLPRA